MPESLLESSLLQGRRGEHGRFRHWLARASGGRVRGKHPFPRPRTPLFSDALPAAEDSLCVETEEDPVVALGPELGRAQLGEGRGSLSGRVGS